MISISYIAWYAKTCQAKKIEPLGWTHYIWSKCVFWGICVKFWSHRTTVNDDAAAQQISASPLVLRFHSHSLEVCPIDVVQGEGCMRWDLVDEKNLNFLREGAFFHTSLLVKYFVLIWETGNERPISPKVAKITTVKEGKFRHCYEMKNCRGGQNRDLYRWLMFWHTHGSR